MKQRKSHNIQPTKSRGFTLMELLIVVAIMGIILLIALPNYTRMAQRAEVARNARSFESALNMARQQAYDSGQSASVCLVADVTSNAQQACQDWGVANPAGGVEGSGWIVFRNTDGDANVDANETVYNRFQISGDNTVITWNRANNAVISLSPRSGTNNDAGTMTAYSQSLGQANGASVVLLTLGKVTYTPPN